MAAKSPKAKFGKTNPAAAQVREEAPPPKQKPGRSAKPGPTSALEVRKLRSEAVPDVSSTRRKSESMSSASLGPRSRRSLPAASEKAATLATRGPKKGGKVVEEIPAARQTRGYSTTLTSPAAKAGKKGAVTPGSAKGRHSGIPNLIYYVRAIYKCRHIRGPFCNVKEKDI